ncbi:MAG: iron ABC transporter permease [Halovenus sp.]
MAEASHLAREYRAAVSRRWYLLALSGGALMSLSLVAITIGPTDLSITEVVGILLAGPGSDRSAATIVWHIRIPRILTALVVGTSLALAGAVMQSVLDNPLGSPYTLGISHAAMFGAALSIVAVDATGVLGIAADNPYMVTIAAFLASLLSAVVILALATYRGASPETMILTGIALGSLFTAGTTALQYFASQNELASIVFWSFGDAGRGNWTKVAIVTAVLAPSIVYFLCNSWTYNALDAGDETARGVGIDVESARNRGMLVASLITALSVAFVGIVGFVGLVVPHVVRKLVGNNKEFLLPGSALVGALLLLVSDTAARTAFAPTVLPVGIVTSFLGAPFFIYLVIRGREYWR